MDDSVLNVSTDQLAAFCQRHQVRKLSLFGSVLRGALRPDSDLDILVEFEPEARIDLFDMVEMEEELTGFFGRKVDLRTPLDLSRHFRQSVLETARPLFERS